MSVFDSEGVPIAYQVAGHGRPITLVHGFAASIATNWEQMGWIRRLARDGRRVIALDCRGHGGSGKPHDPEAYGGTRMADDVVRLLDHLGVGRSDLFGYSLGAQLAALLLARHPERFPCAVLGGIGSSAMRAPRRRADRIAEGMTAPEAGAVTDAMAREFRAFAEKRGNDLAALAAILRADRDTATPDELARVAVPVLVIVGADDSLIRAPESLAAAIPGAEFVSIPDKDHLTVVNHHRFKDAVMEFLSRHAPTVDARAQRV